MNKSTKKIGTQRGKEYPASLPKLIPWTANCEKVFRKGCGFNWGTLMGGGNLTGEGMTTDCETLNVFPGTAAGTFPNFIVVIPSCSIRPVKAIGLELSCRCRGGLRDDGAVGSNWTARTATVGRLNFWDTLGFLFLSKMGRLSVWREVDLELEAKKKVDGLNTANTTATYKTLIPNQSINQWMGGWINQLTWHSINWSILTLALTQFCGKPKLRLTRVDECLHQRLVHILGLDPMKMCFRVSPVMDH